MPQQRTRCLDTQSTQQGKGMSVIHSALILFTNQKSLKLSADTSAVQDRSLGSKSAFTLLMPISEPNAVSVAWASTGMCHLCCHGILG